MPRDKDNPIREYFEEDLPEERFHRLNERLQEAIDGDIGSLGTRAMEAWKLDWEKMFGMAYPSHPAVRESFWAGIMSAYRVMRNGEGGFPFVRWSGCLWHLLVDFRKDTHRAVSACGEEFPVGERVEGKVDTYPHQCFTCMECWGHVEAMRVALILGGEAE